MNRLPCMRLMLGLLVAIGACLLVASGAENSVASEPAQYLPTTKPSTLPAKEEGNREAARSLIFVCDSSGSMLVKLPALKASLLQAVRSLSADKSFNVIFFGGRDENLKCFADALVPATKENQAQLERFLNAVKANGRTDPIPGIEAAFHQRPELIYLLTDGDFPDNDAVLAKIRELDKDKKVKINTIAFIDKADKDVAFKQLLQTIAKENGGTFRLIHEEDL